MDCILPRVLTKITGTMLSQEVWKMWYFTLLRGTEFESHSDPCIRYSLPMFPTPHRPMMKMPIVWQMEMTTHTGLVMEPMANTGSELIWRKVLSSRKYPSSLTFSQASIPSLIKNMQQDILNCSCGGGGGSQYSGMLQQRASMGPHKMFTIVVVCYCDPWLHNTLWSLKHNDC